MTEHDDFHYLEVEIERLRAVLKNAEKALLGNAGSDNVRTAKALLIIQTMDANSQQEPNATGGVDLAVLRGQVLLLKAENEQLRAQLSRAAAIMADVVGDQGCFFQAKGWLEEYCKEPR